MSATEADQNLANLADEANAAHAAAQKSFACGVEHARRAGEALNEAKAAVGHGAWGRWLTDHFRGSERSAQVYMRLARVLPEMDDETRNAVADLSLREAIRALSEPEKKNSETEQGEMISVRVIESEPVDTKVRINVQESHDVAGSTAPSRTYLPESPRTEAATDNVVYPPFLPRRLTPQRSSATLLDTPGKVTLRARRQYPPRWTHSAGRIPRCRWPKNLRRATGCRTRIWIGSHIGLPKSAQS